MGGGVPGASHFVQVSTVSRASAELRRASVKGATNGDGPDLLTFHSLSISLCTPSSIQFIRLCMECVLHVLIYKGHVHGWDEPVETMGWHCLLKG